ncbi:MAG: 4-(cytidine 5'-diphospho)-2-C-methyl-D-erythritol kinase [Bacteroidota bacterium]
MADLRLTPFAKVNLGLFIKGKREDGYHLLETCLYPLQELTDELVIRTNGGKGCNLKVEGLEIDAISDDNLCVKAYELLAEKVGGLAGVDVHLTKHIPAGAGLGGGSSDAAHMIRGLVTLFDLSISIEEQEEVAGKLGADVPFFLHDGPMIAEGIGTELTPIKMDLPYRLEWKVPNIHSSTVAAYRALDYRMFNPGRSLAKVLQQPIDSWKDQLENDLEVPIFGIYPELKKMKEAYYEAGAVYAAMSGSGSTVFALMPE